MPVLIALICGALTNLAFQPFGLVPLVYLSLAILFRLWVQPHPVGQLGWVSHLDLAFSVLESVGSTSVFMILGRLRRYWLVRWWWYWPLSCH